MKAWFQKLVFKAYLRGWLSYPQTVQLWQPTAEKCPKTP